MKHKRKQLKKAVVKKTKAKPPIKKKNINWNAKKTDKNDNMERGERPYKFDERLVPYFNGGDSKASNITIREALIKLGKTPEMTELFAALRAGNIDYRDEGKATLIKALYAIINGHDKIALLNVYEEDIQAIHDHNLKQFDEFWEKLDRKPDDKDPSGLN